MVTSRNCAGNTINLALYGGCITKSKHVDILTHQEVPIDTFQKFTNPDFTICQDQQNEYITILKYQNRIVGMIIPNIGMASTTKGCPRLPKPCDHGSCIVWND